MLSILPYVMPMNCKLSQSNTAKLSRLEPAKQKTAAILLASGQIKSVDEYEPELAEGRVPKKSKQDKGFLESIANLKDPTKDVCAITGAFFSEYRAMVNNIQRQISSYHEPCYDRDISGLSQPEIDELQRLTDSCCEMMQDFVKQVKEGKWRQHA